MQFAPTSAELTNKFQLRFIQTVDLLRQGGFFYIELSRLLSIAGVWACRCFKSLKDAHTRKKKNYCQSLGKKRNA